MSDNQAPQLYLITPPTFDVDAFPDRLARVLDAVPVACLRLAMAGTDETALARAADALRAVAHARDVAMVIDSHVQMALRLGLDGVHLPDGVRRLRKARAALGSDAIVGAFCGSSRHDGISAGEAGADYVSFGPVGATALGDGTQVGRELFEWWSEMIELPVVAEGALTSDLVESLAPVADFIAVGEEIWSQPDPLLALEALFRGPGLPRGA